MCQALKLHQRSPMSEGRTTISIPFRLTQPLYPRQVQRLMRDPAYLQTLLLGLSGVDAASTSVQHAVSMLQHKPPVEEQL